MYRLIHIPTGTCLLECKNLADIWQYFDDWKGTEEEKSDYEVQIYQYTTTLKLA